MPTDMRRRLKFQRNRTLQTATELLIVQLIVPASFSGANEPLVFSGR